MIKSYWRMVDAWRAKIDQPLSDSAWCEGCWSILREHIDQMARMRIGQTNAPLRFYADMFALWRNLMPGPGSFDALARYAIWPSYGLVHGWLMEHGRVGSSHGADSLGLASFLGYCKTMK